MWAQADGKHSCFPEISVLSGDKVMFLLRVSFGAMVRLLLCRLGGFKIWK